MLKKIVLVSITVVFAVILVSCGSKDDNLKEIQKKQSGNYSVSLLASTGNLKQGSNVLIVEFRNISNNELADPGSVTANAVMRMSGGMPMSGEVSVKQEDTPGRYEVKCNFSMSGAWNLVVNFGTGQSVQFSLSVV